ncbi:MAG TPA: methyltransferase domain-containing protein [candidate division Zixibacteria bacterium]|nr:methyltransferase domain-containing protein [candidate division Zixibacteria bacterium]
MPIHHLKLEDYYPQTLYKAVVIWDVLEHLYDPIETLKACERVLEPGGFIFAQVPNLAGLSNRFKSVKCRTGIKNNNYGHFGFPWHLFSFNKSSLSKLVEAVGFTPLHFESWSHLYKDGKSGIINNLVISTIKKFCLSDYIIIVAKKTRS